MPDVAFSTIDDFDVLVVDLDLIDMVSPTPFDFAMR